MIGGIVRTVLGVSLRTVSGIVQKIQGSPLFTTMPTYNTKERFHIYFDLREPGASILKIMGLYEPDVQSFFECRIEPGMTVVDVGTNKGFFLFLAASRVGSEGRVVGFEPEPLNYNATREAIQKNDFENITLIQCAVGNDLAETELHLGEGPGRNSLVEAGTESIMVRQTTIDEEFSPGMVDFLKIDIEGGEWSALHGGKRLLAESEELTVICEIHPENLRVQSVQFEDIVEFLEEFDFEIKTMQNGSVAEDFGPINFEVKNKEFHIIATKSGNKDHN